MEVASMHTKELIVKRINTSPFRAFTTSDFLDLGTYKNASKVLETLEDDGILKRARRGIYYLSKKNELLGIEEAPDVNEIAKAIARQYNFNIVPSSNYALNIIGISTQVPHTYTYISSGPYNEYKIGKMTIKFKHGTSKEINNLQYKNLIAIQAIKALGKNNIDENIKHKINVFLDESSKAELRENYTKITAWIYDLLKSIINEENNV